LEPGLPIPGGDHGLQRPQLHLHHEDPTGFGVAEKALGLDKGSSNPNTKKIGTVTRAQLEDVAKAKMPDLTAADLDAAVRTIAGSARSMGLNVQGV
jgi:large subunit ribosomal protein L11